MRFFLDSYSPYYEVHSAQKKSKIKRPFFWEIAKNCFTHFAKQGCQLCEISPFFDFVCSVYSVALIWHINCYPASKFKGFTAVLRIEFFHLENPIFSPPVGKMGKKWEKLV